MIEFQWRKAEDNDPNGVIQGLTLPLSLVVLQYREVGYTTIDNENTKTEFFHEWEDVPIEP